MAVQEFFQPLHLGPAYPSNGLLLVSMTISDAEAFLRDRTIPVNSNRTPRKHWFHVWLHFALDVAVFCIAFTIAMLVRFGPESESVLGSHWPFEQAHRIRLVGA